MINRSRDAFLQLQGNAEKAINEQFYRALFDQLWILLSEQAQARLRFYNRNQQRELARLRLEYKNPKYDLKYRAGIIADLIKQEQQYAPELCGAITAVLTACTYSNVQTLKSYYDAKTGIQAASTQPPQVKAIVDSVLNVYDARQSNCNFLTSQVTAFQETRESWFPSSVVDAHMKTLVLITSNNKPVIQKAETNASQGPIFDAILTQLKHIYNVTGDDVNTRASFVEKFGERVVNGKKQGETHWMKRLLGGAPQLIGRKKDTNQKSEYDRIDELLKAAEEYDAQQGSELDTLEKQAKGKVLRDSYQNLNTKVVSKYKYSDKNKDESGQNLIARFTQSSLKTIIKAPSALKQHQQDNLSLSARLIEKLANLFNITYMDIGAGPLNRDILLGYFQRGEVTYRAGAFSGQKLTLESWQYNYGTLEKLLNAVEELDKSEVKNREQLVDDIKRRLARLRARYPEKQEASFDEFLVRMEYPVSAAEISYMAEVAREEQALQSYIALWDEAHPNGQAYDLDNLPENIAAPTIEEIQQLIRINLKLDVNVMQNNPKYIQVLTKLAPLYAVSRSLYYVILQAYALALENKMSKEGLEKLLAKISSVFINKNEAQLLPQNYTKDSIQFSWPAITVTKAMLAATGIVSPRLSVETLETVFPPPPPVLSPVSVVGKIFSPTIEEKKEIPTNSASTVQEKPVTQVEEKNTEADKFKEEFEKITNFIKSAKFKKLTGDQLKEILIVRDKYPGQPQIALREAVIAWFLQANPYLVETGSTWNKKLIEDAQASDKKKNAIDSVFSFHNDKYLHDSEKRFINELAKLHVKAAWPEFAEAMSGVQGKSTNFNELSPTDLSKLLNLKTQYPGRNQDIVLMHAIIKWFVNARTLSAEKKTKLNQINSQIEKYLAKQAEFPDIQLPGWAKPESAQRVLASLGVVYEEAKMRNSDRNKAVLCGKETTKFDEYALILKSVINPVVAVSEYDEYLNQAEKIFYASNPAVIAAQIICQYYHSVSELNKWPVEIRSQFKAMKEFFLEARPFSNFSIAETMRTDFLTALNAIKTYFPASVCDVLSSIIAMIPAFTPAEAPRDMIIKEPEKPVSTKPTTDTERLSSNARLWGYETKDCGSDGDCFFLSVADQLKGDAYTVKDLRLLAALELRAHKDYYESFFATDYAAEKAVIQADKQKRGRDGKFYASIDQWINAIEKTPGGEWADELVVQALARKLKKNIVIISSVADMPPQVIKCSNHSETILLGNLNNWHYQSLQESIYSEDTERRSSLSKIVTASPSLPAYPLPWFSTAAWAVSMRDALKSRIVSCFPALQSIGGAAIISGQIDEALKQVPDPGEDKVRQKATALYCLIEVYVQNAQKDNDFKNSGKFDDMLSLIDQGDKLRIYLQLPSKSIAPDIEIPNSYVQLNTVINDWNDGKANTDDEVKADWLAASLPQVMAAASETPPISNSSSSFSSARNSIDNPPETLCELLAILGKDPENGEVSRKIKDIIGDGADTTLINVLKNFYGYFRKKNTELADHALPSGMESMITTLTGRGDVENLLVEVRKIAAEKTAFSSRFFTPLRASTTLAAYQCMDNYLNNKNDKKITTKEDWDKFIDELKNCAPKSTSTPTSTS